jgi:hypothetical protein
MNIGGSIGKILKAVIVLGLVYMLAKWQFDKPQDGNNTDYAEQVCVDEISDRFDVTSVTAYAVNKTQKGFVVRASITLAKGTPAKVYCLTNEHGGVEEIRIEER